MEENRVLLWKDIESAPKDGMPVLLTTAGPQNYYPERAYWDIKRKKWVINETTNGTIITYAAIPTHWMELPISPQ